MTPARIASQLSQSIAKERTAFTLFFLSIFFLFGLIGLLNHSLWRDEMTIWLIARDTQSMAEFLQVIRYEPHPALWYFCVAFLYRLARNPISMQLFHLLLGMSAAYLFINHAPFNKQQRVLFIFGYLPFYEYLIISRNYSLGMLFAFLFCTLYSTRKKTYLWLAISLFFMANSNAYSLFIAIALGMVLIVELTFCQTFNYKTRASRRDRLISFVIFVSGIATSIFFLIPPADNIENGGISGGWNFVFNLRHLFTALSRLWNSYIVVIIAGDSKYYSVILCGLLSVAIMGFVLASLARKPLPLLFYAIATGEILLFTYLKFLGAQRHFGHLYLVLIVAYWLANYYPPNRVFSNSRNGLQWTERWGKTFLTSLLCLQLIGGLVAFSRDLTLPYSAGKATAQYLKAHHLDRAFIVGSEDVAMAPLCGYLNRKIYYPERQDWGSFVLFNRSRQKTTIPEVLEQVAQHLNPSVPEILLILNTELKEQRSDLSIRPLEKFVRSLIDSEKYYLYRVRKARG